MTLHTHTSEHIFGRCPSVDHLELAENQLPDKGSRLEERLSRLEKAIQLGEIVSYHRTHSTDERANFGFSGTIERSLTEESRISFSYSEEEVDVINRNQYDSAYPSSGEHIELKMSELTVNDEQIDPAWLRALVENIRSAAQAREYGLKTAAALEQSLGAGAESLNKRLCELALHGYDFQWQRSINEKKHGCPADVSVAMEPRFGREPSGDHCGGDSFLNFGHRASFRGTLRGESCHYDWDNRRHETIIGIMDGILVTFDRTTVNSFRHRDRDGINSCETTLSYRAGSEVISIDDERARELYEQVSASLARVAPPLAIN